MTTVTSFFWAALFLLLSAPALAQQSSPDLEAAEVAIAEQRWNDALGALERAHLADPDPYYIYRRILVLEQMGEPDLALTVLEENRADLVGAERVTDLAVLEERLRQRRSVARSDVAEPTVERTRRNGPSLPLVIAGGSAMALGVVLAVVGANQVAALDCNGQFCFHVRHGELGEREYEGRRLRGNVLAFGGAGLAVAGATTLAIAFVARRPSTETGELSFRVSPTFMQLRYTFE